MSEPKRQELEITISPDGETVTIHTQGIKGKQCVDATAFLEDEIGLVEDRKYTQEYHQQPEKNVINIGFNRG